MASPMSEREKITGKLLKEWEKIEDEVLIREVATKGKFINLLQQFLSKRSGKPLAEVKQYFMDEIDKYVHRLLSNRQVHKAELVLKNVGRKSQPIFYEFVQTTSREQIDDDIKEHVLDHLHNTVDNFDLIRDEYDFNLLVLRLIASNKLLRRQFEDELHQFTLEALDRQNAEYQQMMAVTTCFQCKNAILLEKLDKRITWLYLWKTEQFQYISKWLQLLYASKCNEDILDCENGKTSSTFDIALKNQFLSWEIDADMFESIQDHPKLNEMLLNGFAQNGLIAKREADSIVTIFQRIFTTESLTANADWLLNDENLSKILRIIFEQNDLVLLLENRFSAELIEKIAVDYPKVKHDIDLCLALKSNNFSTQTSIARVSQECSKYILKTSDVDFYTKVPHVYILEKLLQNMPIAELALCEKTATIVSQITVLDLFFRKLRTTTTTADYDVTLNDLLKLKNIDLTAIRSEVFTSGDSDTDLITFSNVNLNQKYGQSTLLNYIDYVKQHRCSYAVYKFFVDQLINYSQISRAQIQIASGAVCELAINNIDDDELIAHCVAFIEMLGINSQVLRAFICCCRTIKLNSNPENVKVTDFNNDDDVVKQMENILLKEMQNASYDDELFDAHKFESLRILCRAKNADLPSSILKEIAARSNWFRFLLFAAYHSYSIRSIVDVCQMDCFENCHIGLNIGRALKEIIVEDEMPKRTSSFSFREHKRKIQNKMDASHLLNVNHKSLSNSMIYAEKLPTTKLTSSHLFLNINDDMDIFAVILICACESKIDHEPTLTLTILRDLMKNPESHQPTTYFNLLRYAFKMKWPILTVLAATVHDALTDYCWIVWLIISIELNTIPNELSTFEELIQYVITHAVQQNYVRTLHQSFDIFYPSSKFSLFTRFLSETSRYHFTSETSTLLMDFLYELDEGAVSLNSLVQWSDEELLLFVTTLLIEYVKTSFKSMEHCQQLLDTICASGIGSHIDSIDFCSVAAINQIIRFTKVRLNIDEMICRIPDSEDDEDTEMVQSAYLQNEYIRICDELVAEKAFSSAIEIADLLGLSKDSILYEQWIHLFSTDEHFDLEQCDRDIARHSISPLVLINFLLFVSGKLNYADVKKYAVLKKVLNAIKKHHLYPNDGIQRDRVEYDMYKCLLKNDTRIDEIEMYHSEYFETIMMTERGVLYKSFLDLKDLAGVDQLTVVARDELLKGEIERLDELMNRLLEQGDIVQALRLQGIFNHRTLDLHYLVFCMALAENLASLYDLSAEQKQMLNEGLKQAASKFNRRTLRLKRLNTSCSTSTSSSPVNKTYLDSIEPTRVDFEEIPPSEKQDLLEAIQSLASRVKYGFKLAQRIAMAFRAAMHLEKEYLDVLQTKDPYVLLQNAIVDPCLNRLLVMSDIMTSMQMTGNEIANFIAEQIARAIIKSRFYLLQTSSSHSFGQNFLWDYDLDKDFHLFLELCPNTSMLGHHLLSYCDALKIYRQFDSVKNVEPDLKIYSKEMREIFNNLRSIMENQVLSHKKQNTITVELLIKAHDCFVHECSMEGIAFVLQRCKNITTTLATAKSWHLIVKLLMGVGRYRDMYYCFETLLKNDQFESLLGQFDEERANGLKDAIISYLREHHPDDKENYRLAALHFQMFHELAQISETEARGIVDIEIRHFEVRMDDTMSLASLNCAASDISSSTPNITANLNAAMTCGVNILACSKSLMDALTYAMEAYAHAAENYLLENKLGPAQKAASNAELVAMQIHLIRNALDNDKTHCISVLNIRNENVFRYLVNNELNIPQSLILSRTYPYEIVWTESIFNQYIIQGKDDYIIEYCVRMELTDDMVEHLVKNFLQSQTQITAKMEKAISTIVEMSQSITLRYKLASLLSDKRIIANLINGDCLYYLKDTNYGRSEIL